MTEIKNINITELIPYEKNPRDNKKAVKAVANSIKEFGFKVPIVIDKNNVIVAGHTRHEAAKLLSLTMVPCVVADDLSELQIKAYRLADNKTGELADWDFDLLTDELEDLLDFDMNDFGFDDILEDLEKPERKDISDKLEETYELIIDCGNEIKLEETYYKMMNEGYKCRTLIL